MEHRQVFVHQERFVRFLTGCLEAAELSQVRERVHLLKEILLALRADGEGLLQPEQEGEGVSFRQDVLLGELDQILAARTLQRARYYLRRLRRGTERVRVGPLNDINLLRWKEYDEVLTDSLWILPRRDNSGTHLAWYWGNFVPQIPRQMMLRYSKQGEWVLDPFCGSGTTLIECRRLGRNGLGVELNAEVAVQARAGLEREKNPFQVVSDIAVGDSTALDFGALLRQRGCDSVQLIIMHPPYHDIIRFSDDPQDLSNADSVDEFLEMFGRVVDRTYPLLDEGRFLAVVIGDKYARGEWIPLGFYVMQEVQRRGYQLKSIVVKNFEDTRAKRQQQELWRYRALSGGFYLFKHEYVLIFTKTERP